MDQKIQQTILFLLVCSLYACVNSSNNDQERFITRDGLEPDKWASVWLVKTIISPDSEVIIKPPGASLSGGTPFAVPESAYKRTQDSAAFSSLIEGYGLNDPVLQRMSGLLVAIETASWSIAGSEADVVEQGFRRLQERHGKVGVPVSCYLSFFDRLYQQLKSSDTQLELDAFNQAAICDLAPLPDVRRETQDIVTLIPTDELLHEISMGKKVIFVDSREPEEFQEMHIPGAINIPLREVGEANLKLFEGADRVVSYCIKDFRGYEVARALAEKGVKNSSTMRPYGLAGWRSLGLPVTLEGQDDSMGMRALLGSGASG